MKQLLAFVAALFLGLALGYQVGLTHQKPTPPSPAVAQSPCTHVPVSSAPTNDPAVVNSEGQSVPVSVPHAREAIASVKHDLIDPDSARFRAIEEYGVKVCGEVNSRNRFGGYTGFQIFMYDIVKKSAIVGDDNPGDLFVRAVCDNEKKGGLAVGIAKPSSTH